MRRGLPTIVVEPRTVLREGLASLLGGSRFNVIARVATPDELTSAILARAGLVILGVCGRPRKILDWLERVSSTARDYKVVATAEECDQDVVPDVSTVMRCGADGYVVNVHSGDVLLRSLDLALLGQKVVVLGRLGTAPSASDTAISAGKENAHRQFECVAPRGGSPS